MHVYNAFPCSLISSCSATKSTKRSKFVICYLSFTIPLSNERASEAIFTLLSFFTVMTTGWINCLSVTSFTFSMWPSSSNISISACTASCNCMGTLLPFCCVILFKFDSYFVSCFLCRSNNSLNYCFIFKCSFCWSLHFSGLIVLFALAVLIAFVVPLVILQKIRSPSF